MARRRWQPPTLAAGFLLAIPLWGALRSAGRPPHRLTFAAPAGQPTTDELLQALGRELWVIGDELLTVSARINAGASLGATGIALRNAADLMLDGNWEDVSGELETAACSCDTFLPYELFEGMVNLFSYYEPLPQWEWGSARLSLASLGQGVERERFNMLRNLDGPFREETSSSITFVVERLMKSARLFEPGGFYMPPADPRDKVNREGRGKPRDPEPRPYSRENQGPSDEDAWRRQYVENTVRDKAQREAEAAGNGAVILLEKVEGELEAAAAAASPAQARRRVLRRLLRDLHPDRNPDRQADVRPAFDYIVRLREEDKS